MILRPSLRSVPRRGPLMGAAAASVISPSPTSVFPSLPFPSLHAPTHHSLCSLPCSVCAYACRGVRVYGASHRQRSADPADPSVSGRCCDADLLLRAQVAQAMDMIHFKTPYHCYSNMYPAIEIVAIALGGSDTDDTSTAPARSWVRCWMCGYSRGILR